MSEQDYREKYEALRKAVFDVYYGAYWLADRTIPGDKPGDCVWSRLRDAAEFEPGKTKDILGPSRFGHMEVE